MQKKQNSGVGIFCLFLAFVFLALTVVCFIESVKTVSDTTHPFVSVMNFGWGLLSAMPAVMFGVFGYCKLID